MIVVGHGFTNHITDSLFLVDKQDYSYERHQFNTYISSINIFIIIYLYQLYNY